MIKRTFIKLNIDIRTFGPFKFKYLKLLELISLKYIVTKGY